MIPIEVLKKVTVVYVHKNCPDGLASAMILKDAFRMLGRSPRIEFIAHNTPEHKSAGLDVCGDPDCELSLFCDIAPHPEAVLSVKGHTIVLDHHKEAESVVRSLGELGVFADEKLEPGVSGAVLAFREAWLPARTMIEPRPLHDVDLVKEFAGYVGARDTWQTKRQVEFMRGQWISSMLMAKPVSYWMDENERGRPILPYLNAAEMEGGRCLFEAHEEAVQNSVKQLVSYRVSRTTVEDVEGREDGCVTLFVFQDRPTGFRLSADVAEAVRKDPNIGLNGYPAVVAGFYFIVDKPGDPPRLYYSLRGLNGFDVCALAKANGGGGHTLAAAFSVPHAPTAAMSVNPYLFIFERLGQFL